MGDSGIIILFTAGSENQCTDEGDLEPVASSTVRLMNVAFGNESDSELDELASETNGLTYTVETSSKYMSVLASWGIKRLSEGRRRLPEGCKGWREGDNSC